MTSNVAVLFIMNLFKVIYHTGFDQLYGLILTVF